MDRYNCQAFFWPTYDGRLHVLATAIMEWLQRLDLSRYWNQTSCKSVFRPHWASMQALTGLVFPAAGVVIMTILE